MDNLAQAVELLGAGVYCPHKRLRCRNQRRHGAEQAFHISYRSAD